MRGYIVILILTFSWTLIFSQSDNTVPYKILTGHQFKVNSIIFSNDNKYLISTSWDNTVRIWDLESFDCIKVLKGHTDNVWGCAISSDNKKIASTSLDGNLIIWDFKTGDVIKKIQIEPYDIINKGIIPELDHKFPNSTYSIDFSPDDEFFALGSADNLVRIYDARTYEIKVTLQRHTNWVLGARYSKNGKYLITGGFQSEVIIWETTNYRPVHIIIDKDGFNSAFAFTNDNKKVIITGNCNLIIVEIDTGETIRKIPVQCSLQGVQLTNDEKFIITCAEDYTVRMFDYETGKEKWIYKNFKPEVSDCKLSPNNKYLAAATPESNILIWKMSELIENK